MIDVSVIVALYNSDFDKAKKTILSIIEQKNIKLEIILADDGSKNNIVGELEAYLTSIKYTSYVTIRHNQNVGTCRNILDALKKSSGEYIKLISPGDFLANDVILERWIAWCRKNRIEISFGIVKYYYQIDSLDKAVDNVPNNIWVYKYRRMQYLQKVNYTFLSNCPVGAGFLTERTLFCKYLDIICQDVIYVEDYTYKLMSLDNIYIGYYSEPVIYYEYGTGVSTSNNSFWRKKLDLDKKNFIKIIETKNAKDSFSIKYVNLSDKNTINLVKKLICVRGYIFLQIAGRVKNLFCKES